MKPRPALSADDILPYYFQNDESRIHTQISDFHGAKSEGRLDPERIFVAAGLSPLITAQMLLLLVSVLPFISDAAWRIVATLRDALAPGSYLVLAHATAEDRPVVAQAAEKVYNRGVSTRAHMRSHEEILRFFDGFELVDPGLVYIPQWRPDSPADVPGDPGKFWVLGGVGRRP
jgi:S-adenosyl methyltransferase